jgi:hypothetical protein
VCSRNDCKYTGTRVPGCLQIFKSPLSVLAWANNLKLSFPQCDTCAALEPCCSLKLRVGRETSHKVPQMICIITHARIPVLHLDRRILISQQCKPRHVVDVQRGAASSIAPRALARGAVTTLTPAFPSPIPVIIHNRSQEYGGQCISKRTSDASINKLSDYPSFRYTKVSKSQKRCV